MAEFVGLLHHVLVSGVLLAGIFFVIKKNAKFRSQKPNGAKNREVQGKDEAFPFLNDLTDPNHPFFKR